MSKGEYTAGQRFAAGAFGEGEATCFNTFNFFLSNYSSSCLPVWRAYRRRGYDGSEESDDNNGSGHNFHHLFVLKRIYADSEPYVLESGKREVGSILRGAAVLN